MALWHQGTTKKTHRFGPPAYEIHGNVVVVICEDAQHEADIA